MVDHGWLTRLAGPGSAPATDGLVLVKDYCKTRRPPDEVAILERAEIYGATAVFFEAGRDGRPALVQALIFVSDGPAHDQSFAQVHQRLWSWGGVPLVYRVTPGLVQLFRCAHKADFESKGELVFKPYKTLKHALQIANDPWWDAERLRNGTLWDDPEVCRAFMSAKRAASKTLIEEVRQHAGIGLPAPRCRPLDDAVGLGSGGYFVSCVLPKTPSCGPRKKRHFAETPSTQTAYSLYFDRLS